MDVMINGSKWRLRLVRPTNKYLQRSDGSWTIGMTDGRTKTIYVADNLSDYMEDRVILHELTHAHSIEYGYSIPIDIEEMICDFMSLHGRSIVYLADGIIGALVRRVA